MFNINPCSQGFNPAFPAYEQLCSKRNGRYVIKPIENHTFSHNVFKSILPRTLQHSDTFGKGIKVNQNARVLSRVLEHIYPLPDSITLRRLLPLSLTHYFRLFFSLFTMILIVVCC